MMDEKKTLLQSLVEQYHLTSDIVYSFLTVEGAFFLLVHELSVLSSSASGGLLIL